MNIQILYEDKDILVIDKPSGISVHSDGKNEEQTITDWVLENYKDMENVGELMGEVKRPGIVHRLDRETSGVLILAKNQSAHQFIKKQFQDRTIKKTYIAIVSGFVKKEHDVIDEKIGRSPSDFRRRLSGRGARGEMRDAVTEYKVLKRFEDSNGNKFSFLEVYPKTGRTHQIRVHMKFINCPIACDKLYAPKNPCPRGLNRLALHAKSIEFQNLDGEILTVSSPLPLEFSTLND